MINLTSSNTLSLSLSSRIIVVGNLRQDKEIAQRSRVYSVEGIAPTISATIYKEPNVILVKEGTNKVIQLGNLIPDTENFKNKQAGRVYSTSGISPTLNTCGGGQREPRIIVNEEDRRSTCRDEKNRRG